MNNVCVDWVYAILPDSTAAVSADVPGVAGEVPHVVRSGSLAAIVGSVPAGEFSEDSLQERLGDLSWLESSVRAHHRVVEAAALTGTVLPLRFATIYRDDERVREMLRRRESAFTAALSRLSDRAEWGVKAYADPEVLAAGSDERSPEADTALSGGRAPESDSPGTSYLLRKRARQRQRENAGDRAAAYADRIHATLTGCAVRAVLHPPQDAGLARYQGWMVLNASYLADDARAGEFASAVANLDGSFPGIRLELSGPWPAYSFVADSPEEPEP
ncbi:GvpL/GvpF family gas vesicle protein [Embleya sp. NPDC050493]|uniref:GvpL/GvpF family gas vesicle protein n=1 Tax=Embleya sp. NPDC050493 TaxID=3363989 RepID=UPI003789EC84